MRFFILLTGESEKCVFGVPVSDLDVTEDGGLKIPSVLVTMKNYLYENGGIQVEGILHAGSDSEMVLVKDQLNRGTFCGCKDIHAIANLIKVWFRELPEPILNVIPAETLNDSAKDFMEIYHSLPEPNKSLLQWLLDLLTDVAAREKENKMGVKTLAIVISPNLYSTNSTDPIAMQQKVVAFIQNLITTKELTSEIFYSLVEGMDYTVLENNEFMDLYLCENLFSTLLPALESLSKNAEKLIYYSDKEESDEIKRFNPCNFLAEFLMRNNPRYGKK